MSVLALQRLELSSLCSDGSLVFLIGLLASNDVSLAGGWANMGNSNMDLLSDHAVVDLLVDLNTNCSLCNIEHNTSSAMVELVWHTLVDGRVNLNVNIVSTLEINAFIHANDKIEAIHEP